MRRTQTTRRGLIGAGAAVLLAGTAGPAAAAYVGAKPRKKLFKEMTPEEQKAVTAEIDRMCQPPKLPNPDAELLASLSEFDKLVIEKRAAYACCRTPADEEAIDAQIEPLEKRLSELLDLICKIPASTLAGVRARARSLVLWDGGDWLSVKRGNEWISAPDDPDQYDDKRLVAALVRDLAAQA
jgi:hypothetical protein